ncbi:hypothetical protein Ddc_12978 [Ditylenchus destructor]|nr:hypothetical protein Ddc_12978 [Ditylenchus destructor]
MGNANGRLRRLKDNLPRNKVEIPEDCWLDVLKFLTPPQWPEIRLVSRQIKRIAERNVARWPRVIIEKAILDDDYVMRRELKRELSDVDDGIVAYEGIVTQSKLGQWFENRGFTLAAPVHVPAGKVVIGKNCHNILGDALSIAMYVLGPVQQSDNVRKLRFEYPFENPFRKQRCYKSVLFLQFSPPANSFWPTLELFLLFLFHPCSYVKNVQIFAVNQKIVNVVKETLADFFIQQHMTHIQNDVYNKPPYIHCGTFTLPVVFRQEKSIDELSDFRESLKWLERNVRADSILIYISAHVTKDHVAICHLLNGFVFETSRMCAGRELRLRSNIQTIVLTNLIQVSYFL